jgi:hypothetical protein
MKTKRRKLTAFEQLFIRERANKCCEYCKFPVDYSHDAFHIEHIIPLQFGGSYELYNLALACDGCNSYKWAHIKGLDSLTGLKSPIFNPRKDVWSEHFIWTDDFAIIQGITPQGRATVDLLQMNRIGLVNVRKALRAYGVHPAI